MMHVDGACHCGEIAFKATVDPDKVTLCHCNDCQITAGAPYTFNVPAEAGTFEITKGAPKTYIKTTAASGRPRAHGFCPTCATRIFAASVNTDPIQVVVRAGTLKQRADLTPKRQIWCSAALDWALVDGPARIEGQQ